MLYQAATDPFGPSAGEGITDLAAQYGRSAVPRVTAAEIEDLAGLTLGEVFGFGKPTTTKEAPQ